MNSKILKRIIGMTGAMMFLVACSTMQTELSAEQKIQKLQEAGYTKQLAETSDLLEYMQAQPQQTMIARKQRKGTRYTYVDVENCNCQLAGDEQSYQKYQELGGEPVKVGSNTSQALDWYWP